MNHLRKYEELHWADINPFDKDKVLNKKYIDAISKVNINGIKLEKSKENEKYTYTSKVDNLNIPIKGYKHAIIYVTKPDWHPTKIECKLQLIFDKSSPVFKILSIIPSNTNLSYIEEDNGTKTAYISRVYLPADANSRYRHPDGNLCSLVFSNSTETLYNHKVDQITTTITSGIKDILNQDWKKVKDAVDRKSLEADEKNNKTEEINKKRQTITSNVDEISDLLIDIEGMSKKHSSKVNGDTIEFMYEVPGIKVEETHFSKYVGLSRNVSFTNDTAKMILTKELIDVMNAIEAFKKRLRNEVHDSEIKVHLKNDLVMIIIELPKKEENSPMYR